MIEERAEKQNFSALSVGGADGGSRTLSGGYPPVFETGHSANSCTSANSTSRGTRTPKPLRAQEPKPCVSTSFTMLA